MIYAELNDQLGNQMFTYASVKSIAEKLGVECGFVQKHLNKKYINDTDPIYGNTVSSIFGIKELVDNIPENVSKFSEPKNKDRKGEYYKKAFEIEDNTVLKGHFISTKYFENNIKDFPKWFAFPQSILEKSNELTKNFDINTCAVHFRMGNDYRKLGYLITKSYYKRAMDYIKSICPNVKFVFFYDKLTKEVKSLKKKYGAKLIHETLAVDMCCMSKFKYLIIANSSFSIMSALLGQDNVVVRPSKYPCAMGIWNYSTQMPQDIFLDSWHIEKAHRSISSTFRSTFIVIGSKIKRIIKPRKK